MSRYKVWNKEDPIITPNGLVFSAEQWKAKYPVAAIDTVKIVCGGGVVNGACFGIFEQMIVDAEKNGCDFTGCETDQDKLDAIEAFEDTRNAQSEGPTTDERIAAALEYQIMASLPDEEV